MPRILVIKLSYSNDFLGHKREETIPVLRHGVPRLCHRRRRQRRVGRAYVCGTRTRGHGGPELCQEHG